MSSIFGSEGKESVQVQDLAEQASHTIATGIPGFDDAIGQGLPAGNIYLVPGQLGSSADLFVQQILYNTIVSKSKVTYYTVTTPSSDIIKDMLLYKMGVEKFVDDGTWVFARIIPPKMKEIIDSLPENPMEQRVDLGDTLANLTNHLYDSISEGRNTAIHLPDLMRIYSLDEIQGIILYITSLARKFGGIHFMSLTEGAHEQHEIMGVKDMVDSVFEFTTNIREDGMENTLTIQKARDLIPKKRIIRLSQRETGLATETIRRIQ